MRGKNSIWLKHLREKGVGSIDRDVLIFAFFLFLSFIFWYLNSLGKITESEVKYPVRYINIPKERVLNEDLPARLDLFIKGPGYSLLKLKLSGNRAPLILDISALNYRRVPGSKSLSYYLLTENLKSDLSKQLRAECEIAYINPDTLFFSFDRLVNKQVPVTADVEISTERQYFVKGKIIVFPESVTITGPEHILDTVHTIRTKFKRFSSIRDTIKTSIKLKSSRDFTISEKKVTVMIPVEQFTEAEILVPVRILNRPDSVDIKIFPDKVTVKGLIAVSDYKKFSEVPFEVFLDLAKVNLSSSYKIPVEFRNIPPFVNSLRVTPASVDFLLEKKTR